MLHDIGGSSEDWELKGEGNANAVFAYRGDRPDLRGRVLRVPKTSTALTSTQHPQLQELDSHVWARQLESQGPKEQRQIDFENIILRPLLGSQYIHSGETCLLPPELVAGLVAQLQQQGRRGGSSLSDRASLLPDHTLFCCSTGANIEHAHADRRQACAEQPSTKAGLLLRGRIPSQCSPSHSGTADPEGLQHSWNVCPAEACVCVELKPKCGFLPACSLIRHPVKRRMSRYQAHQRLKLVQGRIACISSYDPLDLFSRSAQRMETALEALFAQPQNNLRLFWRGTPVCWARGQELEDVLLPSYGGCKGLVRLLRVILQREGMLDKLLAAQQLDTLDVEVVHPLLQHLLHQGPQHSPLEEKAAHAQRDFAPPGVQQQPCADGNVEEPSADVQQGAVLQQLLGLTPEAVCEVLRNYLTAATAKDSSIMVTLAPVQGEQAAEAMQHSTALQQEPCRGAVLFDPLLHRCFRYKVAFVDLDLKPVWKIEEHFRLDRAIMAVAT